LERKGLGKGLGALIPGAERTEKHTAAEIDVDRIRFNPYQPRESIDEEKLQELVSSIRVHGVLQPVVVRPREDGAYELVAGERRLRAAIAAGLKAIPVVVRDLTNEQSLEVALIENLQREDINPIDAAQAYRRLTEEFGLSQEELAFGLGKSRSAIANTLRLLNLPGQIRDHVKAGRLTEGHARAILAVENERTQLELAERILEAALSVREAERVARRWSSARAAQTAGGVSRETSTYQADPNIVEIEARLREIFRTRVRLVMTKDRGRIEIEFYTADDFDRILNLLAGG